MKGSFLSSQPPGPSEKQPFFCLAKAMFCYKSGPSKRGRWLEVVLVGPWLKTREHCSEESWVCYRYPWHLSSCAISGVSPWGWGSERWLTVLTFFDARLCPVPVLVLNSSLGCAVQGMICIIDWLKSMSDSNQGKRANCTCTWTGRVLNWWQRLLVFTGNGFSQEKEWFNI